MAYKNRSAIQLHNFFKFWNTDVPSIDSLSYQKLDDKVKEAYNVFAAFYQPLNIKALGGSEWGENIYKNTKFLIIQNAVNIYITDKVYYSAEEEDSITVANINRNIKPGDTTHTVWLKRTNGKLSTDAIERFGPDNHWSVRKDSLYKKEKNFKPKINCEGKYPLYLTDHYNTILNSFLGNKSLPLGAGDIMNPARSKGESAVRQKFLENFIKIWYGHWGGYWQLYSYPVANTITFDKNFKYAEVAFTMIYEGGVAKLKNSNGKWELISSKRTWIE